MKVTGFTIVRNAIKYDYPALEAITSVLPLCDEFVVAVGKSEDETLSLIQSIKSDKIKIIETEWDETLKTGGRVLAVETNKAIDAISKDTTWAFYIQCDEVVHEQYHHAIRLAMKQYAADLEVEGLLFKYTHFYGSFNYVADSRKWYRNEIRVFRHTGNVVSYRDAQGFRKTDNTKLCVKPIDAHIYHYGWVRPPKKMAEKVRSFHALWHTPEEIEKMQLADTEFDYSKIDSLSVFHGTHPQVMRSRIENADWNFHFNVAEKKYSLKNKVLFFIERLTGWRIGEYKNYKLI
ncbi:glycosyltransferase family 2 protein [Emticicia sp. 21SJ11W-3]|uniref:glycosyltransferase family 2 protein n=1 Tax=Emticicia sp. 21SJ11W-3 TaxID=2916755 RepID=UPI00209EEB61|nr:glycosyltransferase family 2 protein [Emticicia sp. 21SJ11W-3]UTA69963.1 glycosyltransferase family 2 protein [Emticicia sp. 21SJ11W-3]